MSKHILKNSLFKLLLILLTFLAAQAISKDTDLREDTITSNLPDTISISRTSDELNTDEDFSPGLFFMAMFGFGIMLLGVGCGIALTFIVVLVISVLVSIGVLSAAVLVGLNKKSYTAGFKTLVVLGSAVGGIFLGSAGFWVLNKIMKWWPLETALVSGALAGLIGGLLFGFTCWYVFRRLTGYFKSKLKT